MAAVTGFPEGLDGRVKTLHPNIFAGLLARQDLESHTDFLGVHGIRPFHIVGVNLYDFVGAVAKPGATFDNSVENIDIGGPSMIRAAAKNWRFCLPVVDPDDYALVINELDRNGILNFSDTFRLEMQLKAFELTARYDAMITAYLRIQQETRKYQNVTQ